MNAPAVISSGQPPATGTATTPVGRAAAPLIATARLRPAIERFGPGRAFPLQPGDVLAAEARLEAMPTAAELHEHVAALERIAGAPTLPAEALPLLSLLVDGFPHSRPANALQIAAVMTDLLCEPETEFPDLFTGYDVAVVAIAVRQLLRRCRFLPTACEVIEECRVARWKVRERLNEVRHLLNIRLDAERVLALAADAAGGEWSDEVEF